MYQQSVEYFCNLIVDFLNMLTNNVTHNHGWSIVILTLVFRILILPLTMKSLKSMKSMQELQPKLKELQEKYKDDKERQTREMMALYKSHGANPFGGCLPMLLQIPIFILLFTVLRSPERNGFMLVNAAFYGMDLTTAPLSHLQPHLLSGLTLTLPGMINLSFLKIAYFQNAYFYAPTTILVILMGATTLYSQASMTMDPQQKPMMIFMNFFLIYISLSMPSGVLLYWVFSNVFQSVQQKIIGSNKPAEPAAAAGGKGGIKLASAAAKTSGKGAKPVTKPTLKPVGEKAKKEKPAPPQQAPGAPTGTLKKDNAPKKKQGGGGKRRR